MTVLPLYNHFPSLKHRLHNLKQTHILTLFVLLAALACLTGAVHATTYSIERVSVSSAGSQGTDNSYLSAVSGDGRYIAFLSYTDGLVPGDNNSFSDVFVRDRQTNTTTRVSVDSAGAQANSSSALFGLAISDDGRYVAFDSIASNLVVGDTNALSDIFVHDQQTGTTTRVSVDSAGAQANGESALPSISADGRYVAFQSDSTNLVAGDTNAQTDIFVHDRQTGVTTLVSISTAGQQGFSASQGPTISADGSTVAFMTNADNLVADDTNFMLDVLVRDLQTGVTTRASVSAAGEDGNDISGQGYTALSADGRFVAFNSSASNLVANDTNNATDVFVRDRLNNTTIRANLNDSFQQTNGGNSYNQPRISANGLYVVFSSDATNLVPGDSNASTDIFVRDTKDGKTLRASVNNAGVQANGISEVPALSGDGRFLSFSSYAVNLVTPDTNGNVQDVYLAQNPFTTFEPAQFPPRGYYTTLPFELTWTPVTWANRYEVQIDKTSTFAAPVDLTIAVPDNTPHTSVNSLESGSYYWRVRACPLTGVCGAWSAPDSFVLIVPD